ncbi:Cof-type HAD-IIB family hydrolase [Corallincola spongiicola]|uniref:Cof-type HAD-IIB family hydrolase n=2 Tax=Corallincola spongiicola TaxID=2520508 RepID=A0ABY1WPA4_9GAMM|nr:Cof-type HAD-IIB family hydrolase [Corallincola spongiicola]
MLLRSTMMIKAIVSDLDGTLLNDHHTVGDYTQRVLNALTKEKGMKLILASGRHWADVEMIRQKLNVEIFLITSNGSRVHNREGQCIFRHDIPAPLVESLLQEQFSDNIKINIYQDDNWWVTRPHPEILEFHKDSGFKYQIVAHEKLPTSNVAKLFWLGEHEELLALESRLKATHGDALSIAFSLPICLEVMAGGVSKGEALKVVMDAKGLTSDQVVAFGDGLNDQQLLEVAGHGAIMANGSDELKRRLPGLPVIGSHVDEAVAHYLSEHFLSQ